jgi:hypothetical protein
MIGQILHFKWYCKCRILCGWHGGCRQLFPPCVTLPRSSKLASGSGRAGGSDIVNSLKFDHDKLDQPNFSERRVQKSLGLDTMICSSSGKCLEPVYLAIRPIGFHPESVGRRGQFAH